MSVDLEQGGEQETCLVVDHHRPGEREGETNEENTVWLVLVLVLVLVLGLVPVQVRWG